MKSAIDRSIRSIDEAPINKSLLTNQVSLPEIIDLTKDSEDSESSSSDIDASSSSGNSSCRMKPTQQVSIDTEKDVMSDRPKILTVPEIEEYLREVKGWKSKSIKIGLDSVQSQYYAVKCFDYQSGDLSFEALVCDSTKNNRELVELKTKVKCMRERKILRMMCEEDEYGDRISDLDSDVEDEEEDFFWIHRAPTSYFDTCHNMQDVSTQDYKASQSKQNFEQELQSLGPVSKSSCDSFSGDEETKKPITKQAAEAVGAVKKVVDANKKNIDESTSDNPSCSESESSSGDEETKKPISKQTAIAVVSAKEVVDTKTKQELSQNIKKRSISDENDKSKPELCLPPTPQRNQSKYLNRQNANQANSKSCFSKQFSRLGNHDSGIDKLPKRKKKKVLQESFIDSNAVPSNPPAGAVLYVHNAGSEGANGFYSKNDGKYRNMKKNGFYIYCDHSPDDFITKDKWRTNVYHPRRGFWRVMRNVLSYYDKCYYRNPDDVSSSAEIPPSKGWKKAGGKEGGVAPFPLVVMLK